MQFDFDPKAASAAAKRLRAHLAREGIVLKHAAATEGVARVLSFENASAMRAALDGTAYDLRSNPLDGIDLAAFTRALRIVLEEAEYAMNDRVSGLEEGLYDPEGNDIDGISAATAVVRAVMTRIAQQTPGDAAGERTAAPAITRREEASEAAFRHLTQLAHIVAERDLDNLITLAPDGHSADQAVRPRDGTAQLSPMGIDALRERLDAIAAGDLAANVKGPLLTVIKESQDTYRLVTALPYDRSVDPATQGSLNRALEPEGLAIFDVGAHASPRYRLMADDDSARFHLDWEAEAWLIKQAALGQPVARRAFGFLLKYAPTSVHPIQPDDPDRLCRKLDAGLKTPRATLALWSALDRARALQTGAPGLRDTPHNRVSITPPDRGIGCTTATAALIVPARRGATIEPCEWPGVDVRAVSQAAENPLTWPIGYRPIEVRTDTSGRLHIEFAYGDS